MASGVKRSRGGHFYGVCFICCKTVPRPKDHYLRCHCSLKSASDQFVCENNKRLKSLAVFVGSRKYISKIIGAENRTVSDKVKAMTYYLRINGLPVDDDDDDDGEKEIAGVGDVGDGGLGRAVDVDLLQMDNTVSEGLDLTTSSVDRRDQYDYRSDESTRLLTSTPVHWTSAPAVLPRILAAEEEDNSGPQQQQQDEQPSVDEDDMPSQLPGSETVIVEGDRISCVQATSTEDGSSMEYSDLNLAMPAQKPDDGAGSSAMIDDGDKPAQEEEEEVKEVKEEKEEEEEPRTPPMAMSLPTTTPTTPTSAARVAMPPPPTTPTSAARGAAGRQRRERRYKTASTPAATSTTTTTTGRLTSKSFQYHLMQTDGERAMASVTNVRREQFLEDVPIATLCRDSLYLKFKKVTADMYLKRIGRIAVFLSPPDGRSCTWEDFVDTDRFIGLNEFLQRPVAQGGLGMAPEGIRQWGDAWKAVLQFVSTSSRVLKENPSLATRAEMARRIFHDQFHERLLKNVKLNRVERMERRALNPPPNPKAGFADTKALISRLREDYDKLRSQLTEAILESKKEKEDAPEVTVRQLQMANSFFLCLFVMQESKRVGVVEGMTLKAFENAPVNPQNVEQRILYNARSKTQASGTIGHIVVEAEDYDRLQFYVRHLRPVPTIWSQGNRELLFLTSRGTQVRYSQIVPQHLRRLGLEDKYMSSTEFRRRAATMAFGMGLDLEKDVAVVTGHDVRTQRSHYVNVHGEEYCQPRDRFLAAADALVAATTTTTETKPTSTATKRPSESVRKHLRISVRRCDEESVTDSSRRHLRPRRSKLPTTTTSKESEQEEELDFDDDRDEDFKPDKADQDDSDDYEGGRRRRQRRRPDLVPIFSSRRRTRSSSSSSSKSSSMDFPSGDSPAIAGSSEAFPGMVAIGPDDRPERDVVLKVRSLLRNHCIIKAGDKVPSVAVRLELMKRYPQYGLDARHTGSFATVYRTEQLHQKDEQFFRHIGVHIPRTEEARQAAIQDFLFANNYQNDWQKSVKHLMSRCRKVLQCERFVGFDNTTRDNTSSCATFTSTTMGPSSSSSSSSSSVVKDATGQPLIAPAFGMSREQKELYEKIREERWPRLRVDRGRLQTSGQFESGQVLCSISGQLVTGRQGEELFRERGSDSDCLWFFTRDGQDYCLDTRNFSSERFVGHFAQEDTAGTSNAIALVQHLFGQWRIILKAIRHLEKYEYVRVDRSEFRLRQRQ